MINNILPEILSNEFFITSSYTELADFRTPQLTGKWGVNGYSVVDSPTYAVEST